MNGQFFKEKGIRGVWRSELRKAVSEEDMLGNCVLKRCLHLPNPHFVAFLVLLGIALYYNWKISSTVTTQNESLRRPLFIHLPGGGHCSLEYTKPVNMFFSHAVIVSLSKNISGYSWLAWLHTKLTKWRPGFQKV